MSYKIRDRIAKLKGVPSKYKRVLDAWATFANKDGSNIHPSKEAVAERAGISRWTVYRATEELVNRGILVPYDKHSYPNGHWTSVYRIDMPMLQNATWDCFSHCSKKPHTHCSKTPKTTVAKPHATLPLDPRSADQTETRAGASLPLVRKQASDGSPSQAPKPEPPAQAWCVDNIDDLTHLQTLLGDYPVGRAYDLISKMGCDVKEQEEWRSLISLFGFFSDNMPDHPERSLWQYWNWNQQHKTGGLIFYTLQDAWHAVETGGRKGAFPQFKKHQELVTCPKRCFEGSKFPELAGDDSEAVAEAMYPSKPAFEVEGDIRDTDCTAHQHKRGTCPSGSACHPNAPEYRKAYIAW